MLKCCDPTACLKNMTKISLKEKGINRSTCGDMCVFVRLSYKSHQ